MLELNISFILHFIFIAFGCHFLMLFFNTLYDYIIDYQIKKKINEEEFQKKLNLIKNKDLFFKNDIDNNLNEIKTAIKKDIETEHNNITVKPVALQINLYKINASITMKKKLSIDNFFHLFLNKLH